ncbi:MAG: Na+/H+ antiporter [Nitrospira sp.]
MDSLHQLEIIILLLAVVLALTTVARRILIPYPILLVIGGLVLGMVPGLPTVTLNPDLVFLVFLPPILWAAAYFTSLRDFRDNLRPISLLAVGLVLATTAAVATVAHIFLGFGWAEAIVLGAIVSPPDAVSATAIGKRLSMPRRIVTILEGESLVNDATALVLYRTAVAAVVSGSFSLGETLVQFLYAAVVGVAVGLLVGWLTRWALHGIDDSFTEIAVTLLAPYVAWVAAESVHASAVLSCVAGGLYLRQHFSEIVAPITRIQGRAVWELVVFLLNGVIFILIGLQLGALRAAIPSDRFGPLIVGGALISVTAILVRLGWVPTIAVIPRYLSSALRARDPLPPWPHLFLVGWTGMRGIVTLAAAMALPASITTMEPFPHRAEIILLSFFVILATLVLQGLTLAPLIRRLGISGGSEGEREEMLAREHAASAALSRLGTLHREAWSQPDHVAQLHLHYERRRQRFASDAEVDPDCTKEMSAAFLRLREETLASERVALIQLRDDGTISDEVLHRLEHELDVEALRLGLGERRISQRADVV